MSPFQRKVCTWCEFSGGNLQNLIILQNWLLSAYANIYPSQLMYAKSYNHGGVNALCLIFSLTISCNFLLNLRFVVFTHSKCLIIIYPITIIILAYVLKWWRFLQNISPGVFSGWHRRSLWLFFCHHETISACNSVSGTSTSEWCWEQIYHGVGVPLFRMSDWECKPSTGCVKITLSCLMPTISQWMWELNSRMMGYKEQSTFSISYPRLGR